MKMRKIFIKMIEFYQKVLSPLKGAPCCKYHPTCSGYAKEALELHGSFKGLILAFWRILRCNPFSKGGYDPVPEKFSDAFKRKKHKKENDIEK